ncbi:caspase family protein [Streptomyces sp. S.PNR 29]|uniref:effector-associated domain 2-containing protein n=1 Tax=Streptomyces sp. S.PNR 29 TaxID=2973805 RepID=UPI0025AFB4B2|nr:caspase family protein [Streptomyces sp. S.PNR 29]MDN0197447.1 caspase family protein [Streptomyces sp. S.PNR 29]
MTGPDSTAVTGPTAPVPHVDPARVHALIVGIEAYDAGPAWDLPGPARDAVAFHRLLRSAGVPEDRLRLHLAPLPPFTPDVPYAPADRTTLRRVLVSDLPSGQGDVLWVWWGGHGVLDRSGRLRLFCADATTADKAGIDLDSALERYAGDAVPSFTEQLWIVDACETFEEALGFREPLPPDALPVGRRTLTHRQTVLRSAGRGRAAVNDPVRGTGLFSDVLLGLLADRAAVLPAPPDPEELFPAVRSRIAALREAGRTLQYPEIRLQSPERSEILPPSGPGAGPRPRSPLVRAVDALLAYPLMRDPAERQTVVAALDPRVTATLPRHTIARTDATGILTALGRRHPQALWDLYDAVVSVDDDPDRGDELAEALRQFAASKSRPHGPG